MKYRPLDLSFIANQYSPRRDNIRNTAQMILANAGWNSPSQATLRDVAASQKKMKAAYAAKHNLSPIEGFFDLLSMPLYGVANALDESIAGHQSDPNDSVIEDIGKTAGGVITGGLKGIGAGARGSTALLDALPGIDIDDEWQSDPTDKTRMGDVAVRVNTGMSTLDAMKPENWSEVQAKLEKLQDKPWWDKSLSQMLIPDDLNDEKAREDFFRNQQLGGIGADIVSDPLNFITFGGKSAANAAKITEGLDAARGAKSSDDILSGLKVGPGAEKLFKDVNTTPAVGAIDETSDILNKPAFSVPIASVGNEAKKSIKTLEGIGLGKKIKKGPIVPYRDQRLLVARISRLAAEGEKNWTYRAADILRRNPDVNWTRTEQNLQHAEEMVKAKGLRHNPKELSVELAKWIDRDVAEARKVVPAEQIVNMLRQGPIKPAAMKFGKLKAVGGQRIKGKRTVGGFGNPALRRSDAQLANRIIRRFGHQVFGKKAPPGIQSPEALARSIASGRTAAYSGPKQANMWNTITSSLKYSGNQKYNKAVHILKSVEDFFISRGAIPHSSAKTSESFPLRLSQVAEVIGPDIMAKNHAFITGILRGDEKALAQLSREEIQAIELLKANEAVTSAAGVQQGIRAGKNYIDETLASKSGSAARVKEALKNAPKVSAVAAAHFGGGDSGARVASEYIKRAMGTRDPINTALRTNQLKTEAWLAKSAITGDKVNDINFIDNVTKAIGRAADLPAPAQLGKLFGPAARVKDWLGARFNAAYGVQDMRPIYLRGQASALSTSARRAKLLNNLARSFDPKDADLWHEAFRTAQANGIATGRIEDLNKEIAKVMENLFSGTGLKTGAIAESTVAGRSRLFMEELNSNLRRFGLSQHQFSNKKKVTDAAGNTHDFSKGADWLKSWEAWNVKNPYDFLHRIQSAVEHTVREKVMFDEIITRFGSSTKYQNVKYGVNHPRLKGIYFTEEGARQGQQFVKMLKEVSTPNSKALQHFDHVLSKLKAALTIYIPGHHWTNLIGDTYYNWIAGVNKPIRYEQATRVMLSQKGRYGDFASFSKLTGPKALPEAIARGQIGTEELANFGLRVDSPQGNKTIVKMANGTKVTADMIYTAAMREGILPSARVLEEITSDVTSMLDKIRPLGGKGQRAAHVVAEVRDHIPRLAQFIDGIAKSKLGFGAAVENSAGKVRKWHPDGLDLTKFERDVMKRVFPFYSWTRKAIPLAIESAIVAGPKVMAYPRIMEALALSNEVDSEPSPSGLFPSDQLFPDWLRDRGIGPIAGSAGNYLSVNPSTPVLDTITLMGHPGQGSLDMLNPMAKVPIEMAGGQTLGRNVPIDDYPNYIAKQIPAVSHLGRASGQFGVSDSTKEEGFPNTANIVNMLTGLKMVNTGKYQKSGQFDLRDYFRQKGN